MKQPDYELPVVSYKRFLWSKNHGTAEDSERPLVFPCAHHVRYPVWRDAADCGGFWVEGKTGEKRLFVYKEPLFVSGGEIAGWRFVQADTSLPNQCTITIYND